MPLIPHILEQTSNGERMYDLYSRLLKDRIIIISNEITDEFAAIITAQLLYLDAENKDAPINIYINSPGGSVTAGLAIVDTMNLISAPVHTTVMGIAASMGTIIASSGEKGYRHMLPNAEYMIHQPLGGTGFTQSSNIQITAKHIEKTRQRLEQILAENSGQSIEKVHTDCDRDYYMDAKETLEYGFIDKIL